MNTYLYTHWSLDAAISSYFARRKYNPDFFYGSGYERLNAKLESLNQSKKGHAIFTDLCLSPDLLKKALQKFEKITIYDHHEETKKIQTLIEHKPKFPINIHFNLKKSGTKLVFDDMKSDFEFSQFEKFLFAAADSYDLWKTDSKYFKYGRILTNIFFNIGLYQMHDWIKSNTLNSAMGSREWKFGLEKLEIARKYNNDPENFLEFQHMGLNCRIYLYSQNQMFVNDVILENPDVDFVTGLLPTSETTFKVSFRMSNRIAGDAHLGKLLTAMSEKSKNITGGGGNSHAAGFSTSGLTYEKILDMIGSIVIPWIVKHDHDY